MIPNRSIPGATVIPVLVYPDVRAAVAWLTDVFGFVERVRIGEDHRAQMQIGADGAVIVADVRGDQHAPVSNVVTHLLKVRVDDVAARFERAEARGARVVQEPTEYEYGEREFTVEDLAGHRWQFTQTVRDVAPEEWGAESVPPSDVPGDERVKIRRLARTEHARVGEIDRTEQIDLLYEQRGTELVERPGNWSASAWDPDGHGEHSTEAMRDELDHHVDAGGVAFGAFVGGRLVGIGVVVPHVRPSVAQLAFLHVTRTRRAAGVGSLLSHELDRVARDAGDSAMVVSATPSANTVRFYRGRGFEPMAEPLPELLEREPEDVHMRKVL